jgi:hypothetical protein
MNNRSEIHRPRIALGALLVAAASLFAVPGAAVGTRSFQLSSIEDFKGGDLTGVSIDSNGNVRAGLNLGSIPIPDASQARSALVVGESVLIGTGNDGKIYRITGGKYELAATTGTWVVTSMVTGWNGDVYAATYPDGKVFKLSPGQKGGEAQTFVALPGAEDVWSLAFDTKNNALYAATGPEGKVFRIDQGGHAQVYYKSEDAHVVSVAVAPDGTVYAGTNGKALLYKITGPGRAAVLHDFDTDDVWQIAVAPSGAVYAIANKYNDTFAPPKRNRTGPPTPQPARASRPGKGILMRFTKDGVPEQMLDDDDSHFSSLAIGDDGQPYVGTAAEGRLYTVDDNHLERLMAKTDERSLGAVVMAGKRRFVVGSDPVVYREVKGVGGADAVWTSKVLDAGLRATYGRLNWRSTGALELSIRSGNTATPDTTWNAWSAPLGAPGLPKMDPARYTQIRARWSRDPQASLRDVHLYFVTDNARAIITSIEASQRGSGRTLKQGVQASGGEAPHASSSVKISWKVDNPDQDEMRYRLFYRLDSETEWRPMLKASEKLTSADYSWDTSTLPEGTYRIMVEGTDELANPPDRVTKHSLISPIVLVDNTPPVFKSLEIRGRRLSGEVVDGVGPIARIEVSVAGSDEWRPISPKDGVFDQPAETFDADVSAVIPAGNQIVAVRAYDTAGNMVSRNVEAK